MIEHSWNLSPSQAIALQRRLARRVRIEPLEGTVRTVAGTDCAFLDGGRRILAVAVLCDGRSMAPIASARSIGPCRFPYISGLLSFREAPTVLAAVRNLPERPDLLMCDGQGLAHPGGLGLASHIGLCLDLPTIGVAKSRLCGEHRPVGLNRRCHVQLRFDGRVVGSVVRTRTGVRPLFVSVGHRTSLDDAIGWTLKCCRGVRLPEPTRRAHQMVTGSKRHGRLDDEQDIPTV